MNINFDEVFEAKNSNNVQQWTFRTGQMMKDEGHAREVMKIFKVPKKNIKKLRREVFRNSLQANLEEAILTYQLTQCKDKSDQIQMQKHFLIFNQNLLINTYLKLTYESCLSKLISQQKPDDFKRISKYLIQQYQKNDKQVKGLDKIDNLYQKASEKDIFMMTNILSSSNFEKRVKQRLEEHDKFMNQLIRESDFKLKPLLTNLLTQLYYIKILKNSFISKFHQTDNDYLKTMIVQIDYQLENILDTLFKKNQQNEKKFVSINPFIRQLFLQNRQKRIKELEQQITTKQLNQIIIMNLTHHFLDLMREQNYKNTLEIQQIPSQEEQYFNTTTITLLKDFHKFFSILQTQIDKIQMEKIKQTQQNFQELEKYLRQFEKRNNIKFSRHSQNINSSIFRFLQSNVNQLVNTLIENQLFQY